MNAGGHFQFRFKLRLNEVHGSNKTAVSRILTIGFRSGKIKAVSGEFRGVLQVPEPSRLAVGSG